MSRFRLREYSVAASVRLYALMLVLYPSGFRREFGRDMVEVFRVAARRPTHHGFHGLFGFWLHAFSDLVASAAAERRSASPHDDIVRPQYIYLSVVILSLAVGYAHLRYDDDALSIALLLGGGCLFGLARPSGAWKVAFILGMGIPIALLVAYGSAGFSYPHRDVDSPAPIPLIPAYIGTYSGVLLHRVFPGLIRPLHFGGERSR